MPLTNFMLNYVPPNSVLQKFSAIVQYFRGFQGELPREFTEYRNENELRKNRVFFEIQIYKNFAFSWMCGSQYCGSGLIESGSTILTIPDPASSEAGSGSKVLMTKHCNFLFFKNCILLIPRSPSYRRSIQSSKENIHHFKNWNLWTFFPFFGVIFAFLDLDPMLQFAKLLNDHDYV